MQSYIRTSLGSCKPAHKAALVLFKAIQSQANRFLDAQSKPLLACDGIIGKETLKAVNLVGQMYPTTGVLGSPTTDCSQIAENAITYGGDMARIANQAGLAVPGCRKDLISRVTRPEPEVKADGSVSYPMHSSFMQSGFAGIPLWVIALVGAGGYAVWKKGQR